MTYQEKLNLIIRNKDPAIAALDATLDMLYDLLAPVTDDTNNLKEELFQEEKAKNFAIETKENAKKFEEVRLKLLNNPDSLTLIDINYIGIAINSRIIVMKKQIELNKKAITMCEELYNQIIEKVDS